MMTAQDPPHTQKSPPRRAFSRKRTLFYARVTLPAFMQRVQTFFFTARPPSRTVTFWMFGRNIRLVTRWEWLMLRPATGALPQISQTLDIISHSVTSDDYLGISKKPGYYITRSRELQRIFFRPMQVAAHVHRISTLIRPSRRSPAACERPSRPTGLGMPPVR